MTTNRVYVNITTDDGTLIGRFALSADDLSGSAAADASIGARVREQFPERCLNNDGRVWTPEVNR